MSDQTSDRFRRLERPRAAGGEEAPRSKQTDSRIEAVTGPEAAAPGANAPASGGELGRFRAPPEPGLELDTSDHDSQAFLRCAACETDNFRTAAACTSCGADLDTEPQRAFNRRFWAGRRAEAAAEAEASAARQAQLQPDGADAPGPNRQAAEELARAVGDAERRRLEQEGFGAGWSGGLGTGGTGASARSWPLRWLASLPLPWAVGIGLGLVALPFLLYLLLPSLGLVTGLVLLTLFAPARRRRWSDWRNWS